MCDLCSTDETLKRLAKQEFRDLAKQLERLAGAIEDLALERQPAHGSYAARVKDDAHFMIRRLVEEWL
jgi:hypothetical protein